MQHDDSKTFAVRFNIILDMLKNLLNFENYFLTCVEECLRIFQGLLQKDPTKRLTWPEILNHPFVNGHILICEDSTSMPLTRPLSANTLQVKEQQRKEHFIHKTSTNQNK